MSKLNHFLILYFITHLICFQAACQTSQNYSLYFDGKNDWVAVNSPINGDSNYTIEAWFISENPANCSKGHTRIIGWNGYRLEIADCSNELRFYDGRSWFNTEINIADGKWHHVALVRDRPIYTLYLDGKEVHTHTRYNKLRLQGDFSIGSVRYSSNTTTEYWKGYIDEVRIWNIPRTALEITNSKDKPLKGGEAGLVGYWTFDEGPGHNTTADHSSNNNTGVLKNMNQNASWKTGVPLANNAGWVDIDKVQASNFFDVQKGVNTYLHANDIDSTDRRVKDFMRYEAFWNDRAGSENGIGNDLDIHRAALLSSTSSICDVSDPADWQLLGPLADQTSKQENGLVNSVLGDKNDLDFILIGTSHSGIWKKQQYGNTWKNVTDPLRIPVLGITQLIRNPFNANHIIASTGNRYDTDSYGMGIIESFDRGDTWSQMLGFANFNFPNVGKVIIDPLDTNPADGLTLYAIGQQKIFKSTDTGQSWTQIPNPPIAPTVFQFSYYWDIEKADNGHLFVSTHGRYANVGRLWKYDGINWTDLSLIFGGTFRFQEAFITTPKNGKIIVAANGDDGPGSTNYHREIASTIDYGNTWTVINNSATPSRQVVEYSPFSGYVYEGIISFRRYHESNPTQYKYINQGHVDIRAVYFLGLNPNGEEMLLTANDGGVSLVTVGQNTSIWEDLSGNHLPITQLRGIGCSQTSPLFIVAGATHNNTYRYQNGSWNNFYFGDGEDAEVNFSDPSTYYYQGNGYFRKSNSPYSANYNGYWFIGNATEMHPANPNLIYHGRGEAILNIYDAVSDTWTNHNISNFGRIGAIGISESNDDIFVSEFYGDSGTDDRKLLKSTDDGTTWINLSNSPVFDEIGTPSDDIKKITAWKRISNIIVHPFDPDKIWICLSGIHYESGVITPGKFRVLKSNDGGSTWHDYSAGLPSLPCQALEYHKGSNDRIFLGTDVGVFYRDQTMTEWECFSHGLPVCIVNDLDFAECNKKLLVSTHGRGVWMTDLDFAEENVERVIPANQTVVWDTDRMLYAHLRIEPNAKLIIKSKINIAKGRKIMVETGGQLIIDGGHLTNGCGDYWFGIEVWGDRNKFQMAANQGFVELKNATIEFAQNAITTKKTLVSGGWDWNSTGGIIKASNSIFNNCRRSAEFLSFQNVTPTGNEVNNQSAFTRCTFLLTDDYAYPGGKSPQITMWRVRGVRIVGCTFEDQRNNFTHSSNAGIGIGTISASYRVYSYCRTVVSPGQSCPPQHIQNTVFKNLEYGVHAQDLNQFDPNIIIDRCQFDGNKEGVHFQNIFNPSSVTRCQFIIGHENSGPFPDADYGIFIDESSGFVIHENSLEANTVSHPDLSYIGIAVQNSREGPNEIYKNNFLDLSIGNWAIGDNRSHPILFGEHGETGLEYICNNNINNEIDIVIDNIGNNIFDGIKWKQGGISMATGNRFSVGGSNTHVQSTFPSLIHKMEYYFANNVNEEPINVTFPGNFTKIVSPSNTCYSKLPSYITGVIIGQEIQIDQMIKQYQTDYQELTSLNAQLARSKSINKQRPQRRKPNKSGSVETKARTTSIRLKKNLSDLLEEVNRDSARIKISEIEQLLERFATPQTDLLLMDHYLKQNDIGKSKELLKRIEASDTSETNSDIVKSLQEYIQLQMELQQQTPVRILTKEQQRMLKRLASKNLYLVSNRAKNLLKTIENADDL